MSKIKLDKKDYEIIYQLDLNSKQSDAEIARKVRLSREVVNYRIKNLIKKGIIERFFTAIDTPRLGLNIYKILLQFQNLNKKKEEEIIKFFRNLPEYCWLSICAGKWDMIAAVWCSDMHQFNAIYMNLSNQFSKYFMNKEFSIILKAPHYRREYLIKRKIATEPTFVVGDNTTQVKLDKIDAEILKILANNARMSLVDMANKLKISPRKVGYRIKELQNKKIILAYMVALNLNKLNLMFFKSVLYLQNINDERLKGLISYFAAQPNIQRVIYCYGSWELEIEMDIESFVKFEEIIRNIRENFGDIVRGTETIIVSKEFGGSQYFPGAYGKIDKIYNIK